MNLLTTVLSLSLMCLATFAYAKELPTEQAKGEEQEMLWQNGWHDDLSVECEPKDALVGIQSEYGRNYRDRRWRFVCEEVLVGLVDGCGWYEDINDFGEVLKLECPYDYYISGVSSYFSNTFGNNDRIWSVKCCTKFGVCKSTVEWTGYVNEYEGPMEYQGFFTVGLYSIYNTNADDRVWKVIKAKFVDCAQLETIN